MKTLCLLLLAVTLAAAAPQRRSGGSAASGTSSGGSGGRKVRAFKIGSLSDKAGKNIKGEVFVVNKNQIFVRGFNFNGDAPDAFFWACPTKQATPSNKCRIIPHPFEGTFPRGHRDRKAKKLEKITKTDLVLNLPDDMTADKIKNLSIWCRAFAVNFGDVTFPDEIENLV